MTKIIFFLALLGLSQVAYSINCSTVFLETPPINCEALDGEDLQAEHDKIRGILKRNSEENFRTIQEYNLCSDEVAAIKSYTNFAYVGINKDLRNRKDDLIDLKTKKTICLIEKGLSKIPTYSASTYRGLALPGKIAHKYLQVDSIVEESAFVSTDTDFETARHFASNGAVFISKDRDPIKLILHFTNAPGPLIHFISQHPHESEVLISFGLKFRVVSVSQILKDNSEYTFVELEQITNH